MRTGRIKRINAAGQAAKGGNSALPSERGGCGLSEDSLFALVTKKIMQSEPVAREKPASRQEDEDVVNGVRDRSKKATAPEFLRPTGRWASKEALVEDYQKSRDRTINFVRTTSKSTC